MALSKCRIIKIPKLGGRHGKLVSLENRHIPFKIQRMYYIYDVPKGGIRGGHAHKKLNQLIIPVSGSFDITLDDGSRKKTFHLKRADEGLYVTAMIWRTLSGFSRDAICLVAASAPYDESDYHRNYKEFQKAFQKRVRPGKK